MLKYPFCLNLMKSSPFRHRLRCLSSHFRWISQLKLAPNQNEMSTVMFFRVWGLGVIMGGLGINLRISPLKSHAWLMRGNFMLRASISPSNYIYSPMLHHQKWISCSQLSYPWWAHFCIPAYELYVCSRLAVKDKKVRRAPEHSWGNPTMSGQG